MNDLSQRLGFRQAPDPRDAQFPLSQLMGAMVEFPVSKKWQPGPTLDQPGNSCVGHACWQFQASEPIVLDPPPLTPMEIYDWARKHDEWDDNDEIDAGSSVRAGLECLKHHGVIASYFWAESAEQALEYLIKFGPLVFGTDWTEGMFLPDSDGLIRPTGRLAGGHAWFAYGAQWETRLLTGLTSWGSDFAKDSSFLMSFADIEDLFQRGGVAAAVLEA